MGVDVFLHSVRLVVNNWRTALRITGLLYLIYAVPSLLLTLLFPTPTDPQQAMAAAGALGGVGLITGILAIVAFVWIAVAWHRYVLLDEVPAGQFPEFEGKRLLSYGGYSFLLGLVGMVVMLLISGIVGIIFVPLLGAVGAVITGVIGIAAVLIVGYRLAPLLPAIAVDKPISMGAAWQATASANGVIIILAIVSAVAAVVIDIPAMILMLAGPVGHFLATIWALGTGWLKMLVGVSILTTLYGHYIEGRALPAR
jgi:hypothetical protein